MKEAEIWRKVVICLDNIPKPREAKSLSAGLAYSNELRNAFIITRQMLNAESLSELRHNYKRLEDYCMSLI